MFSRRLSCIFLVTLWFAAVESLCLSNCSVFVDSSVEFSRAHCFNDSCNFICNNLAFALTSVDTLCGQFGRIYLASEEFSMEHYGINISKNIIIEGQNTTINCGDISDSDETASMWYFYNYTSIELHGIYFNNCKRPLRFHTGNSLVISGCVFR